MSHDTSVDMSNLVDAVLPINFLANLFVEGYNQQPHQCLTIYAKHDKYSTSLYIISDNIKLIKTYLEQQLIWYAPPAYGTYYANVGMLGKQIVWYLNHGNSSD